MRELPSYYDEDPPPRPTSSFEDAWSADDPGADAMAADAVYRQADRTVDAADRLWFARAGRQR